MEFFDLQLFAEGEAAPQQPSAGSTETNAEENAAPAVGTDRQPAQQEPPQQEPAQQADGGEQRENAGRLYRTWMDQAQRTKAVYPAFDLRAELRNPKFTALLKNSIDVRTAYEVTHKDEILAEAMRFTAQKVEQQLANKIIAGGARPAENGGRTQSPPVAKNDVSQLTKADRQEIIRRVQRGEKIKF